MTGERKLIKTRSELLSYLYALPGQHRQLRGDECSCGWRSDPPGFATWRQHRDLMVEGLGDLSEVLHVEITHLFGIDESVQDRFEILWDGVMSS